MNERLEAIAVAMPFDSPGSGFPRDGDLVVQGTPTRTLATPTFGDSAFVRGDVGPSQTLRESTTRTSTASEDFVLCAPPPGRQASPESNPRRRMSI